VPEELRAFPPKEHPILVKTAINEYKHGVLASSSKGIKDWSKTKIRASYHVRVRVFYLCVQLLSRMSRRACVPLVGSIITLFITNCKVKLLMEEKEISKSLYNISLYMDKSMTYIYRLYIYTYSLVADLIDRWRLLPQN
jgi:hypothetical protein